MEASGTEMVTVHCSACGTVATHHPYVKPLSLGVGLICGRCGNVLGPDECLRES